VSDSNEMGILLVGLPKAGKTSFVAALWHVLTSEEVPGSLRLTSLGGDDTYLNQIKDEWLNYEEVVRTTQQNEAIPTMHLADEDGSVRCVLTVPDLSGETYVRHWVDREWSLKFRDAAKGAAGVLVFIHPNQPLEAPEITPTLRMLPAAQPGPVSPNAPSDEPIWDPEKAAGVVQLVDVLQFLQRNLTSPLRIVIVVSAWDLIKNHYATPSRFLEERTPLLEQFLRTNPGSFRYTVFGVSALGGDLENIEDTRQLQEQTSCASERIEVVSGTETSHDITLPLRRALSWSESDQS
jgi:GTPase SAR1 family protein